jgi:DNA-binding NarL/FixJ family response regulator
MSRNDAAPSVPALYGRRAECDTIDRLLAGAMDAHSGALVLRGEAGVGKTALLRYAEAHADGMLVLRAAGVESEAELPFAALHQLLRPVLGLLPRLPARQAAALAGALGLGEANGGDRFLVSVAVLSLLGEAAEASGLVAIVDEAHWLDRPSADALVFAARRLEVEGVAMLLAARDGDRPEPFAPGLPELRLDGLDADAAGALLAVRGETLPVELVTALVERTGGNPLALIELPAELTREQLAARAPLDDVLPLTDRLRQAFGERVRRLPGPARTLLLVAAAEPTGDAAVVLAAAGALGIGPAELDAAEAAGLVRATDDGIAFRHPLVRSAAYRTATLAERRAAHQALAGVLTGEGEADRRAWHLASAATGPDEAVAAGLEATAGRAATRGGHAAAAVALERAAALTADDGGRGRRLVAAAGSAWLAGRGERAAALLDRAEPLTTEPRVQAEAAALRGVIEAAGGLATDAASMLVAGAELVAADDPDSSLALLVEASEISSYAGDVTLTAELGRRAEAVEPVSKPGAFLRDMLAGMGRLASGDTAAGAVMLERAIALAPSLEDPRHLTWAGSAAYMAGEPGLGHALFARAVARARKSGAAGLLPHTIEYLAAAELDAGRYAAAVASATEGLRLATDTGNDTSACRNLSTLAHAAALRGDEDDCRAFAGEALERSAARELGLPAMIAMLALGLLDLGAGRPAEALGQLTRMLAAPPGAGHPFFAVFAVPELVEAAVRAGRPEVAAGPLVAFTQLAEQSGAPAILAQLARCRALLAEDDEATARFEEALVLHAQHVRPFEQARTELLYGEALRRARRRSEARAHLRAALESFERLGTAPWAERARSELRATGETARKRDPSTLGQLTPQELQIVRLVAEGATNREVGEQLFLSRRTIEYHLRNVFVKLGVSSRTELIRLQLQEAG